MGLDYILVKRHSYISLSPPNSVQELTQHGQLKGLGHVKLSTYQLAGRNGCYSLLKGKYMKTATKQRLFNPRHQTITRTNSIAKTITHICTLIPKHTAHTSHRNSLNVPCILSVCTIFLILVDTGLPSFRNVDVFQAYVCWGNCQTSII